jgi:hypothetical protein
MAEKELPALFEGATHRNTLTGEPVKAVRWVKDGDHPKVERYPIEKRRFKGQLVVSAKEKYGLVFGDWVIEDGAGRLFVRDHERFIHDYTAPGA